MMKRLSLLLLLLAALLVLAACGGAEDPAATTAPVSTAATTASTPTSTVGTTEVTATPTSVTVTESAPPPVTTLPPVLSDNPIESAKILNSGAIQVTYKDKTKQSLGILNMREGYNSATADFTFDAAGGILTLTLTDSSARNVANELLAAPKNTLTVRLREMEGNLEWAPATEDNWQVLCASKTGTDVVPLELLAEATEFGKHTEITEDRVIFAVNGTALRFRAREWKEGTDFVMDAKLGGSSNKKFNISWLAEINSSAPFDTTRTSSDIGYVNYKSSGDDITPINMNGTYIGANHGYFIIAAIPNDSRNPKTEEDIGSIWQVGSNKFVLVRIAPVKEAGNATMLWFCPYNEASMKSGKFSYVAISKDDEVTHVSGAFNDKAFSASADSVQAQFYIAVNHYKEMAFLNGTQEVDLTKNGFYTAEFVDFYEEYDIIYLPEMLEYLIYNVGYNTDEDHYSDRLTESYVTFRNTYRYHKNGACVVYSSYEFHKDVSIGYIGGVQSIPFSESTHYVYVPGTTTLTKPTLQGSAQINVGKDHLADPSRLVTSYFQFSDANGTKGMNLGFNPLYGTGVNDVRAPLIGGSASAQASNLAFYYTSYKMYPRLIANCNLKADTKITCVAYRLPSYVMDDDFTAINWYWVGDEIYLSLHTDVMLTKTVNVLPEYMNGMTATVIESSATFSVNSDTIENGSIDVSTTDAGYAIIKLTRAN